MLKIKNKIMEHNTNINTKLLTVTIEKEEEVTSYVKWESYYLVDSEEFYKIFKALITKNNYFWNKELKESDEYKIWKRKVIADFYANFYITSEEQIYPIEQLKKLNDLRLQQELAKGEKSKHFKDSRLDKAKEWKIGHLITYTQTDKEKQPSYYKETNRFKGEIVFIHTKKGVSKGIFDIRIGNQIIKEVSYKDLTCRRLEDYSDVEIPTKLKEMSTKDLLHELRCAYTPSYNYCANMYGYTVYTHRELKAELSTREHIFRKNKRDAKKDRRKLAKQKM
jgi:hypothetical protein